ncbi:hypothetical protein [Streptomyces anandii]|uniref:hypothetical protein n=1 Tax=Streptomyces anandii TaxID=285454 RepID=UPI00367C9E26
MAAPMKAAAPTRSQQILAKENAIKNRLNGINTQNRVKATAQVSNDIKKLLKKHKSGTVTKSYKTQSILGANKGFSKSDYGVGQGAGIPYQIGTSTQKVTQSTKPKKMTPHYTPAPKPQDAYKKAAAEAKAKALQRQYKVDAIKRRAATTTDVPMGNVTPAR